MSKNLVVASTNWRKSDLVVPSALGGISSVNAANYLRRGVYLAWYLFATNALLTSRLLIRIFAYTSTNILLVWSKYVVRRVFWNSR